MSMGTAYAMRKKMTGGGCAAHGMSDCGECMAKGGEVGVNRQAKGHAPGVSDGGMADDPDRDDDDVVMSIMKKRYSKGGMVANDTPPEADAMAADYDALALNDDLEFHDTGGNSGDEIGDKQEDEDQDDIVSQAMRSRKKKP